MKFAYADPPYHGMGKKRYGSLHPEAGIWDDIDSHIKLIVQLDFDYPDGWALSCNPADLRYLLPHCPESARVAAWVKTFHQIRLTTVQYAWESVIFVGGRKDNKRKPMVRDWLSCAATRKRGIPGAKPMEFNLWILKLLNFKPGEDTIDDLFPGTGGMQEAVEKFCKDSQGGADA